jgi:hypothetical protein
LLHEKPPELLNPRSSRTGSFVLPQRANDVAVKRKARAGYNPTLPEGSIGGDFTTVSSHFQH